MAGKRWLLAAMAAIAGSASAQTTTPMFADDAPVHLTLAGPLSSVFRAAERQNAPQQGTLAVVGGPSVPVAISARGITRRRAEVCQFPPLRLQLGVKPPPGTFFAGQHRLKLVTHCRNDASFQRHVLLEYAAYRMYNLLTPYSFRAKLATIDYVGADGRPMITRPGFLLEDLGDVARRNGLAEAKMPSRIPLSTLRRADAARFALFEYMISNLDWAMIAGPAGEACCHNGRLIGAPGATANLIPVPYDFDFSGLVNAPYATPPEGIEVRDVRQRRYRGYCAHNPEALAAAAQFRQRHGAIVGVLDSVPGLDPRAAATAKAYLEGFFADIATDAAIQAKLFKTCL